ncbi:MAG TPA: hypothetical protein VFX98_07485 [Longimicrobiaceae bacterium]|nr:hypothetical protein [Longimicrobiaceae bacterium]
MLRSHPRAALGAGLLALAALLAACGGDNLFVGGPPAQSGEDNTPPTVTIEQPADSAPSAVGEAAFVSARVSDSRRLASVTFEGFALRGDPNLGTQVRVERFVTKTVDLLADGRVVRDTVIGRFLEATDEDATERGVLLVVTAADTAGNVDADTVVINIGGPRVEIVSPSRDTTAAAGTQLQVRLQAEDQADLISSVRLSVTGALASTIDVNLPVARATLDTTVLVAIPAGTTGSLELQATATSGSQLQGQSREVNVAITGASADVTAPRVSFSVDSPDRVETRDTIRVIVTGSDETRLDSIGASMLVIRRTTTTADTLAALLRRSTRATDTLEFSLAELGLTGRDTMTLSLEVTAYARDGAGNCGAAVTPNTVQSLPCQQVIGVTVSAGAGRLLNVLVARGTTVPIPTPGDRIADLASDGVRVFASNFSRNRVEVLPINSLSFAPAIRVGSQPWGLGISNSGTTLFVANSGSTTISRLPLGATLPSTEDPADRIETPNVELFAVRFTVDDAGLIKLEIVRTDYSDRPQFIGQTLAGKLLYSTKPTAAATPGTLREYDPARPELGVRLFADYARRSVPGVFVVREAEDVFKFTYGGSTTSTDQLVVCDRRPGDPAPTCFPGAVGDTMSFQTIQRRLTDNGFDAVLDFNLDPSLIALTDTTFVAVSRDRRTVAFGEGGVAPGRIIAYREDAGGNTVAVGNTLDLVNNASERVVGLALNPDGTLGAARGSEGYLFNRDLRLQGVVETGAPAGGVALHPDHNRTDPNLRLAFISGEENGVPFIDVVDTFHSDSRRRIVLREPITGALIAVPRGSGDPAGLLLRLFGVTASGIVAVDLFAADLQP